MGIIIRQSIKASIVSYFGMAIGMINVIILATRYFSPEQVGLTRVLQENALLFTSFAQLGAPYIATKYFSYFKNEEKQNQGFLTFLLLYSLIGFLLFSIFYFFSKSIFVHFYISRSPELVQYYYYLLPIVFFNMYMSIIEAYGQVNGRIVVPTIIREVFLKLFNTFLIILFALNIINFDGYLICIISASGIACILLLFYLKHMNWLHLKIDFSNLNKKLLKEMTVYGLFVVLGGIGYMLSAKIDILMLPALTNLQSTGIYVIALYIAVVIEVPRRSIVSILIPFVAHAIKENNLKEVGMYYTKSAINQFIAGSLIFLLIWCNIDSLFSIIPKTEIYLQGKWVVFFISIAKLIDLASGINGEIIINSKYFRFILTSILLLAALTIGSNLIFIPRMGINGAAIAAALSISVFTIYKVGYVWRKFHIQPYTNKTLLVLLCMLLAYLSVLFIPSQTDNLFMILLIIFIKSVIILAVFISLIIYLKVSEDATHVAKVVLNRIKNATLKR